jgi:protein-tyrosine-phosphatase
VIEGVLGREVRAFVSGLDTEKDVSAEVFLLKPPKIPAGSMARVLFVCLHNAGRSQMSEALFLRAAGGRHEGRSAGTAPGERVHPEVVEAMSELDIDLGHRRPRLLAQDDAEWAEVVVTMGCGDECPYVPGVRYVDWDLPDPKGRPIEAVRAMREEISRRVGALVEELDRG